MAEKRRTDAVFGEMKWDANLEWWQGVVWVGDIDAMVHVTPGEEEQAAFEHAWENFENLQENEKKFRTKAAKSVLKNYNKAWRMGRKKLKKAELASELSLSGIMFLQNGGMILDYDADHELFGGHGVMIEFWANGKMRRGHIVG